MSQVFSEIYDDSQPSTAHHENGPVQIDKNIPVPVKSVAKPVARVRKSPKWPVKLMVAGDSFFIPGYTVKKCVSIIQTGRKAHPGSKWKSAAQDGGARVWRTA